MSSPSPSRRTETLTGAQIVVRLLERQGVRTLSGIPGGAILPIYDALSQSEQIHHVLARHEQGAGFIAQGMARASGEVAVCLGGHLGERLVVADRLEVLPGGSALREVVLPRSADGVEVGLDRALTVHQCGGGAARSARRGRP